MATRPLDPFEDGSQLSSFTFTQPLDKSATLDNEQGNNTFGGSVANIVVDTINNPNEYNVLTNTYYVTSSSTNPINGNVDASVCGWVWLGDTGAGVPADEWFETTYGNQGTSGNFGIGLTSDASGILQPRVLINGSAYGFGGTVASGWHFIGAYYNSATGSVSAYVDGVSTNSSASVSITFDNTHNVALYNNNQNCKMTDFQLYNRILTATEFEDIRLDNFVLSDNIAKPDSPTITILSDSVTNAWQPLWRNKLDPFGDNSLEYSWSFTDDGTDLKAFTNNSQQINNPLGTISGFSINANNDAPNGLNWVSTLGVQSAENSIPYSGTVSVTLVYWSLSTATNDFWQDITIGGRGLTNTVGGGSRYGSTSTPPFSNLILDNGTNWLVGGTQGSDWEHHAIIYDATANTIKHYVNQSLLSTITPSTAPIFDNTKPFDIYTDNTLTGFTDILLFNRVLTLSEINQIEKDLFGTVIRLTPDSLLISIVNDSIFIITDQVITTAILDVIINSDSVIVHTTQVLKVDSLLLNIIADDVIIKLVQIRADSLLILANTMLATVVIPKLIIIDSPIELLVAINIATATTTSIVTVDVSHLSIIINADILSQGTIDVIFVQDPLLVKIVMPIKYLTVGSAFHGTLIQIKANSLISFEYLEKDLNSPRLEFFVYDILYRTDTNKFITSEDNFINIFINTPIVFNNMITVIPPILTTNYPNYQYKTNNNYTDIFSIVPFENNMVITGKKFNQQPRYPATLDGVTLTNSEYYDVSIENSKKYNTPEFLIIFKILNYEPSTPLVIFSLSTATSSFDIISYQDVIYIRINNGALQTIPVLIEYEYNRLRLSINSEGYITISYRLFTNTPIFFEKIRTNYRFRVLGSENQYTNSSLSLQMLRVVNSTIGNTHIENYYNNISSSKHINFLYTTPMISFDITTPNYVGEFTATTGGGVAYPTSTVLAQVIDIKVIPLYLQGVTNSYFSSFTGEMTIEMLPLPLSITTFPTSIKLNILKPNSSVNKQTNLRVVGIDKIRFDKPLYYTGFDSVANVLGVSSRTVDNGSVNFITKLKPFNIAFEILTKSDIMVNTIILENLKLIINSEIHTMYFTDGSYKEFVFSLQSPIKVESVFDGYDGFYIQLKVLV